MRTLIVFLFLSLTCISADILKVASGEWPPYLSKNLKHYGLYQHLVELAYEDAGIKLKTSFFPWSRAKLLVKDGKYDASLAWAKTPDREREFEFSVPVTQNSKVFFHLRENKFDWKKIEDLKKYRILFTKDYTYGEIDKYIYDKDFKIFVVSKDLLKMKMILSKRADITPIDIEVGYYLIKGHFSKNEVAQFTHHPRPIMNAGMRVMFSKKIDKKRLEFLKSSLEKGLKKIRGNGKFDRVFWEARAGAYDL